MTALSVVSFTNNDNMIWLVKMMSDQNFINIYSVIKSRNLNTGINHATYCHKLSSFLVLFKLDGWYLETLNHPILVSLGLLPTENILLNVPYPICDHKVLLLQQYCLRFGEKYFPYKRLYNNDYFWPNFYY